MAKITTTMKTTEESGASRAAPRIHRNRFGPDVEKLMKDYGVGSFADLARHFHIHRATVESRLMKGLSIRQAVGLDVAPVRFRRNNFGPEVEKLMKDYGVGSLAELAEHFGLQKEKLCARLRSGHPVRVALGIDRRPGEIATPSKVYPSLLHACRTIGVRYEDVRIYRHKNGCTAQEAFDAVLSARRSKRLIKSKAKLAAVPLPDPVVFGWKFPSWSSAADYWGGMKHAKRPAAVLAFVRTQPLVPESIFAAVRHEFDVRGLLDPETGLIKGRPLPKGAAKA